ncbi:hypothetical protein [Fimbriiglobus ruber]|uniref:Uncharacterized protein n=1 Tax=Fimbriiglobus ruber TaxID=1908690 RepID=A0A225DS71_9BACT|nr:hypothetical protein [Fimbriiglobus ruber]OWK43913.1 hypothetical protein FRUB_03512 [Fimbriiglobus ruber]
MPLSITCPACAAPYQLAEKMRGRKTTCPKCGQRMIITSAGVAVRNGVELGPPSPPAPVARNRWPFLPIAGLGLILLNGALIVTIAVLLWKGKPGSSPQAGHDTAAANPSPLASPEPQSRCGEENASLKKENAALKNEDQSLRKENDALRKELDALREDVKEREVQTKKPEAPRARPDVPVKEIERPKKDDRPKMIDKNAEEDSPRTVGDLKVTTLRVSGIGPIKPCMLWADAKGSEYLIIEAGTGILRRVSCPDLKVTKQKDFERLFGWMSISAQGVLLSDPAAEVIWVVDPVTFEVKTKIPVPKLKLAASAPGLTLAVACDIGDVGQLGQATYQNQTLYVVDLVQKKAVPWPVPPALRGICLDTPAVTPDGAHVFTEGGGTALNRFSFKGGKLQYQELKTGSSAGRARVPTGSAGFAFSPDSKFVCLPNAYNLFQGQEFVTPVYPVDSFGKYECILDSGQFPQAVGIDPKADYIYAQNSQHEFLLYTFAGIKKNEYQLYTPPASVWQFLVHPAGHQIVMLSNKGIDLIKVPKKN